MPEILCLQYYKTQYFRHAENQRANFFTCLTLPSEVNDQPKKVQKNVGAHGFFGLDKKLTLVDNFAWFTYKTRELSFFFAKNQSSILGLIDD